MRIMIVDDHAVVRGGIRRLLSQIAEVEIRETAGSTDAVRTCRDWKPEVIVLDVNLDGESGIDAISSLKTASGGGAVVIFTMYSDPVHCYRAIRSGAAGYVCKSDPADTLLTAIERAAEGKTYFENCDLGNIAINHSIFERSVEKLSKREQEILDRLAEGKALVEIADELGTAYKTVTNTCSRVRDKLGLNRMSELVRYAIENAKK